MITLIQKNKKAPAAPMDNPPLGVRRTKDFRLRVWANLIQLQAIAIGF